MKDDSKEGFLGGFSSSSMRRGLAAGYGIYVTDQRLFGIYDRFARPGPLFVKRPLGDRFNRLLEKRGSSALIKELEQRKDFEIRKANLSSVEIRRPGWLRKGRIEVTEQSGHSVKIWIIENRDFDRTREILEKFCPEILRIT